MIQQTYHARNLARPIRYIVPDTERDERPRTAGIGDTATGILRSVRTRGGRLYGSDTLNFLVAILDQAAADGLTLAEIQITYHRTNITVTYSTSIEALRTSGQRVMGESGWEMALPRQLWSVDGATPEGLPQAKATPAVEQPMLFDFSEPRRVGAY